MSTLRKVATCAACCGAALLGAAAVTADVAGGSTEGRSWSAPAIIADGAHWGFSGQQNDGIIWD